MFDSAKAALLAVHTAGDVEGIKSHAGLIQTFGLHLVRTGKVSTELGKILGRLEHARMLADYADTDVGPEQAAEAIQQAALFIAARRTLVATAG